MNSKKRIFSLDLIRLFSCLCVLTVHFNASVSGWSDGTFLYPNSVIPNYYLENRLYLGGIGVSLFFMLSGATLMLTYKENNLPLYYKKRIQSIYPMFWTMFVFATIVDVLIFKGITEESLWYLPLSFLGMDGYLSAYGTIPFGFYKVGEWFLGCLLCLYLIFPLLYQGAKKKPLLTFLGAMAIYAAYMYWVYGLGKYSNGTEFFLKIPELLLGMFFIKYNLRERPVLLLSVTGVMAASAILLRNTVSNSTLTTCVCALIFALMVVLGERIPTGRFTTAVVKLAGLTYGVFLVHHWMMDRVMLMFNPAYISRRTVMVLFGGYLIASFLGAHFLSRTTGAITAGLRNLKPESPAEDGT